ncbi:MAG: hypothetical protein EZS28_027271 [Streblomastix strix]|uniref:Uncharacterized protein n=1 Tax=Streblomastix strix TaxID=222440 RepID=A0A5J4V480_9EUKA|nr:MAG: hypothetical protein EZS28_027271 [Streblomastix strix]
MKNNTSKSVIQIPKLLQSLSTLSRFKVGSHIDLDVDQQRIDVRHWSRYCLHCIRRFGDAQVQTELVNIGYGRVMSMSFCTAGGNGEEQDVEIKIGLSQISDFLKALRKGRNVSFQVLLLRLRRTVEQIEEEGANEEIDVQMMNKENQWNIKSWANDTKEATLNRFIHKH